MDCRLILEVGMSTKMTEADWAVVAYWNHPGRRPVWRGSGHEL